MTASRLFDLTGRAAVVTGGGGLGLVLAEALAEAGTNVVLCGRDGERCEQAAEKLERTYGGRPGWQRTRSPRARTGPTQAA